LKKNGENFKAGMTTVENEDTVKFGDHQLHDHH
jgi:hypothetical protein